MESKRLFFFFVAQFNPKAMMNCFPPSEGTRSKAPFGRCFGLFLILPAVNGVATPKKVGLQPGRLTWNLKITYLKRESHLPNLHYFVPC